MNQIKSLHRCCRQSDHAVRHLGLSIALRHPPSLSARLMKTRSHRCQCTVVREARSGSGSPNRGNKVPVGQPAAYFSEKCLSSKGTVCEKRGLARPWGNKRTSIVRSFDKRHFPRCFVLRGHQSSSTDSKKKGGLISNIIFSPANSNSIVEMYTQQEKLLLDGHQGTKCTSTSFRGLCFFR